MEPMLKTFHENQNILEGIMDVNYPVIDPKSTMYWIGELTEYTADRALYQAQDRALSREYGDTKVGLELTKVKCFEEEQLHNNAEHGDATFTGRGSYWSQICKSIPRNNCRRCCRGSAAGTNLKTFAKGISLFTLTKQKSQKIWK